MPGFISDLQVGDPIGDGHFGEVFEGVDPAHGKVAVKVLSREKLNKDQVVSDAQWPAYKAQYLAEARNLAKATHKNVVQVYHVVETPDGEAVVICMAFCPGGCLQSHFKRGPMLLQEVRKIATNVLLGLSVMHARGMIHRDIKPANILLNAKGDAQLSDFGLVTDDLILGYGSQAGYLDHIAYEVWNGAGTSARSDIWAVGMTLYRLLHGLSWYEALPRPADIVRDGGFAETLKWLPHIPKPWRRVIRKMLRDDHGVSGRYQTASQALADIGRLPVLPAWQTSITPARVTWAQTKAKRRLVVEWDRKLTKKHEWRAWSEPLATGRTVTLAGSSGEIGGRQAVQELEAFFAN